MVLFEDQNFIQQLSIDCVIFGYKDHQIKVLVPKLAIIQNLWALPGGFIMQNEDIDEAARRILEERTGLSNIYLEQFKVFGHKNRTNIEIFDEITQNNLRLNANTIFNDANVKWLKSRFVSIGYYALVDIDKVEPKNTEMDESIAWYNIKEMPRMIMDHNEIVESALLALQKDLDQKLIAFNLLPETFTMKEIQKLYEGVYDKPLARNNFQKKMLSLNVLERLEKKFSGAAHKAPYLYRFRVDSQ